MTMIYPVLFSAATLAAMGIIIIDDILSEWGPIRGLASILVFAVCLISNTVVWSIWEAMQ